MRIISFAEKWPKLKQPEFTTFRFPRKDANKGRDWQVNEQVQVFYHSRSPQREYLGIALIKSVKPMMLFQITEEEAIADGFPGGLHEMIAWLFGAHRTITGTSFINKLTLRWLSEPEITR